MLPYLPVTRTVLPNGLTVLVREDHGAPVVAIVTWVNAGYFDEPDSDVGISHVLEHMYFKGTPTRGVGEIARDTKASGGYLNAHTIYDHTAYETVLPSSGFLRGLEIQADAYANSLIDADELARELEVIIQEAKRKLDSPPAVALESLFALLHDQHRYRRWRIGDEEGLRLLTRDRMLRFYRNYYRPRNTILVVAGDVDTGEAIGHVTRLYGSLPDEPVERDVGPSEDTLPGFRYRELAGDITQTQVAMAWRTPGPEHPDTPALDLAAALLTDGRGSRLYRGVRERELASQVTAGNHTPRDVGVFSVRTEGDPLRARDAARATWVNVMALRESPPSSFEVERVQHLFEARWLRRQETMEGQADFLAQWEALGGWEKAAAYFDQVMSLDAGAVHNAVARYLDPDQASMLVYRPRAQAVFEMPPEEVRPQLDSGRSAGFVVQPVMPPDTAPMPARVSRVTLERTVGSIRVFRAPSGLPILVRRRLGAPMVNLGLYSAGGAAVEPAKIAGIGTLMMRATIKGTRTRSADAIAAESEMLGGSIGTSVASDGGGWTFTVPNSRWRDAVNLLQDVVQHPRFDAAVLDTERAIALTQLAQLRDDMLRFPVRLAMEAAFPGHPYGRSLLGTEDSLREITAEELRRWHEESVLSSAGVLAAVGDVPEEELAQALADAFAEISSAAAVHPAPPSWPQSMTLRLETRDKAQTALAIGFPGPRRRDPHRYAVGSLTLIASGLGGRFFDELRDKRSLAYTVQAWATERVQAGMFTAYIATEPAREDEARQALLAEFAKLREYPVTPEELTRATHYALGSHAIAQQSGAAVLAELIDAWLFGEGLEELDLYESRMLAVTADDIQRFAVSAFDPERRVEGIVRGK
ncbi:MAG TPA: pitrilysin family protein [Gemmatimonadaceae bacterium]|nr:pitrilysin family protein [Gemmatimonadaceae bacterium]